MSRNACRKKPFFFFFFLLLTFAIVFAFPSNSQNVFGTGRPLITAGILIVVPARQESKSCAPISRKISGSSAKNILIHTF